MEKENRISFGKWLSDFQPAPIDSRLADLASLADALSSLREAQSSLRMGSAATHSAETREAYQKALEYVEKAAEVLQDEESRSLFNRLFRPQPEADQSLIEKPYLYHLENFTDKYPIK